MTKNLPIVLFISLFLTACSTSQQSTRPPETKKPISVIKVEPASTTPVAKPEPAQPQIVTPVEQPSAPVAQVPQPVTPPATTEPVTPPTQNKQYSSFADWKADFLQRATASGHRASDVQRLLDSAQYSSQIVSLDKKQPEFSKMPWEYADSAVSGGRVQQGQKNFANQRNLLTRLESQYGVPAEIVTAIWGMESSYGQGTGNTYLPSALSTLAYDGRRQNFAEEQLLALLQLLQRGDLSWSQLKGSWAGGMGQTQFIPTTWLKEGVDGNGDGQRSPWATADALSSTASYLSNSGWVRGLAPFYEVKLPTSFDYSTIGAKQSLAQWRSQGFQVPSNNYLTDNTMLELWLPAGHDGPALLLSQNFQTIKVYNNSSSYALGVSLLGNAIAGRGGLQKSWPRYEQPLSSTQVTRLQQRLTNAGYDTQGTDGIIGMNTRKAFQRWQADNNQIPDGFISQRTTASLLR